MMTFLRERGSNFEISLKTEAKRSHRGTPPPLSSFALRARLLCLEYSMIYDISCALNIEGMSGVDFQLMTSKS